MNYMQIIYISSSPVFAIGIACFRTVVFLVIVIHGTCTCICMFQRLLGTAKWHSSQISCPFIVLIVLIVKLIIFNNFIGIVMSPSVLKIFYFNIFNFF